MDNETLRAVQLAQLEIALEIKRICEENDIAYFLDCGTLLGAVRHKGFIPWDDDLDVGMLRSEYDRFLKIVPEKLSEQYFIQTWDTDEYYPMPFAKIRKKNTLFIEAATQETRQHSELFIDIFPYDVYPDSEKERAKLAKNVMNYRYMMMMKDGMTPWRRDHGIRRILVFLKYKLYWIKGAFLNKASIKNKLNAEMVKYNDQKTAYYFTASGMTSKKQWLIPAKCFEKNKTVIFENKEFMSLNDEDLYLSYVYGNYMKLPPEQERENHQIVEVKL